MADFEIPKHGQLCWYELSAQKVADAMPFYQELFGWNLEKSKVSPVDYNEIHVNGQAVGGMMAIDESWGEGWEHIPANWSTYTAVDNCDETVEKIKANGGGVMHGPFDAPNVGRIALVTDNSGAPFAVIQFAAM